jgi:hypothetical protein
MLISSCLQGSPESLIDLAPHGRSAEEIFPKGHHVHALQIRRRLHEQDHVVEVLLDFARTDPSIRETRRPADASGDGRYGFFLFDL